MSDTLSRIQETGAACISAYEGWSGDKKDADKREALQDTLHELRKAIARVEIEIATSERDSSSSRKIPIPPHRSQGKQGDGSNESILPDRSEENQGKAPSKKSGSRRPRQRKQSEG